MRRIFGILLALVTILSLLALTGCQNKEGSGKLKIVTTTFPPYDLATQIGGDNVEVIRLLPPGSESHTYDPSIRDIAEISRADIFIYNGKYAEAWAETLVQNAKGEGCTVLDLSEGIDLISGTGDIHSHEEHHHDDGHDYDPHIWTSPENVIIMANAVRDALCEKNSENADDFTKNAVELCEGLERLCDELESLSSSYDGRTLYFGGRFAFRYLFDRYGLSYRSPYQGCGEESEPSIKTITEISDAMKREGVEYIFFEEMSEGKIALGLSEETGAELLLLHSCHNITADEEMAGEDYCSIMGRNIEHLKKALS